jgi:hypothetical protein
MLRPLDSFPDAFGAHRASVFPHRGPVLYAPVVEGVAPANATAGDVVSAVEAGMKLFEFLIGGQSDSGVYFVQCLPTSASGVVAGASAVLSGIPTTTYRLKWMVAATGVEAAAVDLSAEIVRVFAIGSK